MKCPACAHPESRVIDSRPSSDGSSIIRACDKRLVTRGEMDSVVSSIEMQLQNSLQTEIPSSRIGEMVMERLKDVDEVAYVRFASVYRQFKDIDAFLDELNKLLAEKK